MIKVEYFYMVAIVIAMASTYYTHKVLSNKFTNVLRHRREGGDTSKIMLTNIILFFTFPFGSLMAWFLFRFMNPEYKSLQSYLYERGLRGISISGMGGSGKSYLADRLYEYGLAKVISHTSRPPRDNETNGVDYNFVQDTYFVENQKNFIEIQQFNDWWYGAKKDQFDDPKSYIITPSGLDEVKLKYPVLYSDILKVFVKPKLSVIKRRLSDRGNSSADDADRRFKADQTDFKGFQKNHDIDVTIYDEYYNSDIELLRILDVIDNKTI